VSAARLTTKKKLRAVRPTITGKVVAGSKLTVKTGEWGPGKVTLRIQWLRNGKAISKGTKKTYTLVNADVGKKISVKVTGVKKGYPKKSLKSKAIKVQPKPVTPPLSTRLTPTPTPLPTVTPTHSPTVTPTHLPTVTFPDSGLRDCVHTALGKPDGAAVTSQEAAGITDLNCRHRGIASLAGLENLTGVIGLDLWGNQISSLAGVTFPTELRYLDLDDNQIRSLDGVTFPTGLQTLGLGWNQIGSLSGVTFPTGLHYLSFTINQIGSLTGVTFPTELRELLLAGNQISSLTDVAFPAGLTHLTLGGNQIGSLTGVTFPTELRELYLEGNQIGSLAETIFPARLTLLEIQFQRVQAGVAAVGTAFENPLRDGLGNTVTEVSACESSVPVVIAGDRRSWTYTAAHTGEAITWERSITVNGEPYWFSGTLSQTAN